MTKTNDGGPAFPTPEFTAGDICQPPRSGMTLRDWFAGQAIPVAAQWEQMSPTYGESVGSYRGIAERAYYIADAMLAERERKP